MIQTRLNPRFTGLNIFSILVKRFKALKIFLNNFFKLQKSYNDSVELLTLLVLSQFYAFNEIVCTKKYIGGHFYCSFQKSR